MFFIAILAGMTLSFYSCNNAVKDNTDDHVNDMENDVDSMMPNFETVRIQEPDKMENPSETASAVEEKSITTKKNKPKDVPEVTKKTEDKQTKEVKF